MPCRRREGTASSENGKRGGKVKRLKADGAKMGTAEDKEVSWFSYSTSSSYLKNIESSSKPTSQVKDGRWPILRASTGIRGNTEQISVESSTKQPR